MSPMSAYQNGLILAETSPLVAQAFACGAVDEIRLMDNSTAFGRQVLEISRALPLCAQHRMALEQSYRQIKRLLLHHV